MIAALAHAHNASKRQQQGMTQEFCKLSLLQIVDELDGIDGRILGCQKCRDKLVLVSFVEGIDPHMGRLETDDVVIVATRQDVSPCLAGNETLQRFRDSLAILQGNLVIATGVATI